jgi:group I intron endonuclease
MIGYVYKIHTNANNKVYIGSTTRDIETRLSEHKRVSNKTCSKFICNDKSTYLCTLLEVVEFSNISELRKREMFYINSTDNCVNTVKSYISQEEQTQLKEETRRILDSIETCEIRIPIGAAARGGGRREAQNATD